MIDVKGTFEPNEAFFRKLQAASETALEMTADEVLTDLTTSGTMPFDVGTLQNELTHVNKARLRQALVSLVSSGPYARRLYYHPEYNFQRGKNPNAGGEWFEPYLTGAKKGYAAQVYAKLLKRLIGG